MKKVLLLMAGLGAGVCAFGEERTYYSLGIPGAPVLRDTADEAGNVWLASNNVASVSASFSSGSKARTIETTPGLPKYTLASSEAGFSVERTKPEIWLGDALTPPDGIAVDWEKTYEHFLTSQAEQAAFIFDNLGKRVFVQVGGTLAFTWIAESGERVERTYQASGSASARPYKLFWTESPYNSPTIDLNGKFVRLFGPPSLIVPERGVSVYENANEVVTNENAIIRGVYYDSQNQTLSAYGEISGQFLLAYYDTGAYENLKHLQVIEVGRPDVHEMNGFIGEAVKPHGTGYGTKGLRPLPTKTETSLSQEDEYGPYYYQHKGNYSYSPKHDNVYPLRDTSGAPWRIDVYWMEEDPYGVSWPFERCQYSCTWNTNAMPVMVSGDCVKIPADYSVELTKFQEPNGHALAPADNLFTGDPTKLTTSNEVGYSCLKLTTTDNIWFLPVRTVRKDNTDFFRLEELTEANRDLWSVGTEVVPRGGSVAGTAPGYAPVIDRSVPGRIDLADSGSNYNPQLYYDWTAEDAREYPSSIYAVNTLDDDKPLEVHWYTTVQEGDMPSGVSIPCLVQRYRIRYPDAEDVPQIVIASQQGSALPSVCKDGHALYLANADSTLTLPARTCFNERFAGISFWAMTSEVAPGASGRVLTLSNDDMKFAVDATAALDGIIYTLAVSANREDGGRAVFMISAKGHRGGWENIQFSLSDTNAVAMVNGEEVARKTFERVNLHGYLTNNSIGASGGAKALKDLGLDVILVGAFDAPAVTHDGVGAVATHVVAAQPDPASSSLALCLTFPDGDLEGQPNSDVRTATEEVSAKSCEARACLSLVGSAPHLESGVFLADAQPTVYRQNDPALPGYNPNEEHAFVGAGHGGYFAWALRCDLNTDDTSKPFVLVQYPKDGHMHMKCFSVLLTNATYSVLADTMTAGTILPGPHPLDLLDNPWMAETYWDDVEGQEDASAFRDRKRQVWARCAGTLPIHMYYPNQDGFDFPALRSDGAPAVGEAVAWLGNLNNGDPVVWTWTVEWPRNIEAMRIGETLTKAANGLPEVWGAKSMAVVYPNDGGKTALLWDPTIVQRTGVTGYANAAKLLKAFGFDPADRNVTLRAGRYTFKGLPPSIGNRFYVNANLPSGSCVCLEGELATNAGGSILYPNVLNQGEIDAIKALVSAGHSMKNTWDALVDKLPRQAVEPSKLSYNAKHEPVVSYGVKDHYALTAMGATNYVTIIENDSTVEAMRVDEGDPISMHILRVIDDYYAGRVVTREDPLNLLSQQLSILYTESFAGKADDYEFEWKKAVPNANGTMSTDYTNVYKDVFDKTAWGGLTRFTIGQQGDTLANLVNTFYVMRYRAKGGTAPYEVMGDRWSDWCGPALAEGWLQRCVNNVTPFTQRMQDLYENAVETDVTMIRAAGAPWQGDVALNQDNLTEVGLIQLYQTLLNKAESISLSLDVNDTDANKQLLLAAERLCDLYVLLGNEAYADALNPTIGFGSDYGAASITPDVDYGAASTGLFCFDNQVPTLLDEELVLLRGRTGANNPSVTTAPFYNRLVWNFTRGITAGEVAYAMNYNINSRNGDARFDEDDAALQYPQGHGDAYGHYLSAMSVWYRLLRNPNFSWPTSQMQMNVADSVVDVDYYDEERFAETAGKLAKTAAEVMDRTARKAWRENGGVAGAGYLDKDSGRNFGYGEWATRGGIGGVMNWMVANSLLPAAETAGEYYVAMLGEDSLFSVTNAPVYAALGPWTFEVGACVQPLAGAADASFLTFTSSRVTDEIFNPNYGTGNPAPPEDWSAYGRISVSADDEAGTFRVASEVVDCTFEHNTIVTNLVVRDETTGEDTFLENVTVEETRLVESPRQVAQYTVTDVPANAIFALTYDAAGYTLRIIGEDGVDVTGGGLALATVPVPMENPVVTLGGGVTGAVGEMRFWRGVRPTSQLHASRAFVNPRDEELIACTRGISPSKLAIELPDETPGRGSPWQIVNPVWRSVEESGLDIAFDDDGLVRINRATATDLATIPGETAALQRKLDQLDSGLNPLGLSDAAVPFDISPDGVADGTSTHFEQIAARAETALGNAAKILDNAQIAARHLRQVSNAEMVEGDAADESESDYNSRLIAIFGTPYEDDIGPSGTYPQGYDGPDLYHFMYMDLEKYGVTGADNLDGATICSYDSTNGWSYSSLADSTDNLTERTLSYTLSANGLVLKPRTFTGSRKASGKVQEDYADFMIAYADWQSAYDAYSENMDSLSETISQIASTRSDAQSAYTGAQGIKTNVEKEVKSRYHNESVVEGMEFAIGVIDDAYEWVSDGFEIGTDTSMWGIGLSVAAGGVLGVVKVIKQAFTITELAYRLYALENEKELSILENKAYWEEAKESWSEAKMAAFESARDAVLDFNEAARACSTAWTRLVAAAEKVDSTVAEGVRIQEEREQVRARRANRIIKLRYNDMFFRQMQNAALTRYTQAFDLAQKYVYMAAQVYDYETTLLSSDRDSGDAFLAEIVGSRSLGMFAEDGSPLPSAGVGDGGLADILARMKANYLVLKGRLGINNPDKNTTWFSLRKELFRIAGGEMGDADWRLALSKCIVDDIRTVPEYQRYCQSFASTSALPAKEPALVLRFGSTIDFSKNFFGNDLAAGDHSLDSAYYATRIAAAAVRFDGYPASSLAATPVAYLVPAGADRMRIPGGGEDGTVLDWNVADQVIPVPYAIGSTELDDPDYIPLYTGVSGGIDALAKIRRIPSFRAQIGGDGDIESTRLVGRSAWNTQWVLIIPAGQMLGGTAEDRARALSIFINGEDTDRDGVIDRPGVSDIELGLKTYATSGN